MGELSSFKCNPRDFPGGAVVKNLSDNAGDTGLEPWSGKIPHAVEQLSPCAATTEPVLWSLWATTTEPTCHNYWSPRTYNLCSTREATAMRSLCTATKSSPHSPQLEKARTQQRKPNAAKKHINKFLKKEKKKVIQAHYQANLKNDFSCLRNPEAVVL